MFKISFQNSKGQKSYCKFLGVRSGSKVIKLFSCSTQLSLKFILLINVKMSTLVGILTFMSRINDWLWGFKPENFTEFGCFDITEQYKFHARLS